MLLTRAPSPQMVAALPPPKVPEGWQAPDPKPLKVPDGTLLSTLTGSIALALRLGCGVFVYGWRPEEFGVADESKYSLFGFRDGSSVLASCARPEQPLKLYEYEASPYCRKVREACAMLDLDVFCLPCPGARKGFAAQLGELGGKMMVPYLVDPNVTPTVAMYESDDIIEYLFESYGPGKEAVPWLLKGPFAFWTCAFAAIVRGLAGGQLDARARPDNPEMEPIVMWGYEGSPFVRPVREKLNELGLPHLIRYCGRGSAKRDQMVAETGRFQVPFISDPNTGAALYESDAIVKYLDAVYTV